MNNIVPALSKAFFQTIGRTSKGICLCFDEGLTSGKTVDYVYNNKPHGSFLIGKLIDKHFLSHPGWEGVRQRRANLEALVIESILYLRSQKTNISLLDIASGPAAYIISVLEKAGEKDVLALCRDLDNRWLSEGAQAAQAKNLKGVRFERGDAFDAESLLALTPKPNIIIASGFYDWIIDDEAVKKSLSIIHKVLDEKGHFIMTNQTAHPDLEFVEKVFTDFNHQPLKMKMRSENTIHSWLEDAGFKVEKTLSDSKGLYSVTKACKR